MSYPRVLMINEQSIEKNNATGITLRSLWNSWPKENIMEIYMDPREIKRKYLHIEGMTPAFNPLRKLALLKIFSRTNQHLKNKTIPQDFKTSKIFLKTWIRQLLVVIADSFSVSLNSNQNRKLEEFRPQVIYTLGASVSTLKLAYKISLKYEIPIVFHYMDNWVEHIQWEKNPMIKWYKNTLQKWHYRCMEKVKTAIAISPIMKNEYEKKFKKKCYVLMNTVELEYFKCKNFKSNKSNRHFIYAGGLHLDRSKALKDIAEVLKEMKNDDVLDIYTKNNSSEYKKYFKGLPVIFHEEISHKDIKQIYEIADVLVHAEVQNDILLGYFKYSISTKIPEYLATNKPVLFYGPKEMGLYSYLRENDVAFLASDKKELFNTIMELDKNNLIENRRRNAQILVDRNHTSDMSKNILKKVIEMNIE